MKSSELDYPIVATFSNEYSIVYPCEDQFTRSTTLGIKDKVYNGVTIIDSVGAKYRVTDAKIVGRIGSFWVYLLTGLVRVEVTVEKCDEQVNFRAFKKTILQMIRHDEKWSSIVGVKVSDVLNEVKSADTIEEIMAVLSKYA